VEKQSQVGQRELNPDQTLSRRKIFKRAAGVAAVGAAGGSVLTGVIAPRARAAAETTAALQATTVEQGALAPAVVMLTDAPTITVDASQGNDLRVTLAGNRTIGNPANPTDGQKIVFQVTQGSGGGFTLSYGSGFEFSTGLPQPTLSTTAGDTDLLAFVYNAQLDRWLLAAFVAGFSTTVVKPPQGTYRLYPSTNGPSSPVSYSGSFQAGVLFEVTTGGMWFDGYWWWVCPDGQSTSQQKFALWAMSDSGVGNVISAATITSTPGALIAGQWNYVPLQTPVPLTIGACYNACTGFSGSFPATNSQFGSGDPYSAGIQNGPLSAFSDQSGTAPAPFNMPQGLFGVAGTDPSVNMPSDGSNSANFWIDLQVGSTAPSTATYRLWPNYPVVPGNVNTGGYVLATEFQLSQSCTLDNIWFYSPPSAGALPTRCAIWSVGSQSEISGTDNSSPSWTGAAGSGWVACTYSGVTLPAGDYKVAVFYGGTAYWFQASGGYFGSGGPAANGIITGPLTAPGLSAATSPGQGTYNAGSWAYPDSYGSGSNGETYWVDVEVTPTS
jgi:hypothetical protein